MKVEKYYGFNKEFSFSKLVNKSSKYMAALLKGDPVNHPETVNDCSEMKIEVEYNNLVEVGEQILSLYKKGKKDYPDNFTIVVFKLNLKNKGNSVVQYFHSKSFDEELD